MQFHASICAAAVAALLSACGGSGDSPPPGSGTQSVAITAANQSTVARATVNGGFSLALVQDETSNGATTSPNSTVVAERLLQHVLRAAVSQRKSIASASAHPETGSSETDPCGVSGTLTSNWNDVDNNSQLSAGDILTANFQQCQDTPTLSVNGTLTITLTGTPTESQFTGNAVFASVVAVYGGVTYTLNGAVAVNEVDTDTLSDSSFTVASTGLTVGIASTGYSDSIAFDSGMVAASSFLAGSSSLTLNGSFTSQSLGGRVTISTPHALMQQNGDAYPSQGSVLITGASGSTLLVTALNTTQVQLQVDANGDGTVDGTTTTTWTALIP
jgi:hypothetical protein